MFHILWTPTKIDVTNILFCAIRQIRHSNPIFDHVDVTSMRPIHCDLNKLPLSKIHTDTKSVHNGLHVIFKDLRMFIITTTIIILPQSSSFPYY